MAIIIIIMKKFPASIFLIFLLISTFYTGCSSSIDKTLKVGVYQNIPKVGLNDKGEPVGIFIDILEYIAQKENWELEYITATWPELLEKLDTGVIDIMVDVARSEEREKKYDFNQLSVINSWLQLYTTKNQKITELSGLNGKTIAVLEGSVQDSYLQNLNKQLSLNIDLVPFNSYQETIDATEQGVCDILIAGRFFAYQYNSVLQPSPIFLRPSPLNFAVKKGTHQDILPRIDYRLSILMNEDTDVYQRIFDENLDGSHIISIPFYAFWVYFTLGLLLAASAVIVVYLLIKLKRESRKVLETERSLHHTDKLKAIGHLAGGVAHDFNNMLMGIGGYANVMLVNPDPKKKDIYAQKILDIVKKASESTHQLLSFARHDNLERSRTDIHKMAESLKSFLEHSLLASIELNLDLQAENSVLLCQKSQIHSSLLNLCINACDAMPEGGTLTISTTNRYLISEDFELMNDYIYTDQRNYEEGDYLIISISDTGCGMTRELMNNIFTPYFTTKESGKGTGLGMAAVLGTISMHNGVLALNSEVGKGTEVRLYLPIEH
ncbi:MAG: transporter substrate-binding domain-containing protein [Spirochaetales bacterium]|nr:transporter substrate-binding domain-containing protein [Spirochaetales bacterium]